MTTSTINLTKAISFLQLRLASLAISGWKVALFWPLLARLPLWEEGLALLCWLCMTVIPHVIGGSRRTLEAFFCPCRDAQRSLFQYPCRRALGSEKEPPASNKKASNRQISFHLLLRPTLHHLSSCLVLLTPPSYHLWKSHWP